MQLTEGPRAYNWVQSNTLPTSMNQTFTLESVHYHHPSNGPLCLLFTRNAQTCWENTSSIRPFIQDSAQESSPATFHTCWQYCWHPCGRWTPPHPCPQMTHSGANENHLFGWMKVIPSCRMLVTGAEKEEKYWKIVVLYNSIPPTKIATIAKRVEIKLGPGPEKKQATF